MILNLLFLFTLPVSGPAGLVGHPELGPSLTAAFREAVRTERDDPRHPAFAEVVSALVLVNRWAQGEACRFDPESCGARARRVVERTFRESLDALGPLDEAARARIARFTAALDTEVNGRDFARRAFALTNARKIRERRQLNLEACLHVGAFSATVDLAVGISALVCKCFSPQLAASLLIGNAVVAFLTWAGQADERAALKLDDAPNLIAPPVTACGADLRADAAAPRAPSLPIALESPSGAN